MHFSPRGGIILWCPVRNTAGGDAIFPPSPATRRPTRSPLPRVPSLDAQVTTGVTCPPFPPFVFVFSRCERVGNVLTYHIMFGEVVSDPNSLHKFDSLITTRDIALFVPMLCKVFLWPPVVMFCLYPSYPPWISRPPLGSFCTTTSSEPTLVVSA